MNFNLLVSDIKILMITINISFDMEAQMKDHNPHDPLNMIGEAYERLIELTMRNLHIQDGKKSSLPGDTLDHSSSNNPIRNNKTINHTPYDQEFLLLLLANILRNAADKTTLELNFLQKRKKLNDEFHAEELVDASVYYCDHCGSPHKVVSPSLLEKCKTCGHSTFRKTH